ncbi:hypothetical protein LJR039_005414 [Pseudorhodoferax sp. LjRoot39]|uniref:hypothetical protein n=1 Tax=Pseudorhodoferax sp. LjRoot39 TaxID=3342328 RepID=UPI003ECE6BA4
MSFDPETFGKAMGAAIRKAIAPLQAEIEALKSQLAQRPDYSDLIAQEVTKAAATIRVPADGKDCDMEAVREMVKDAVTALPPAKGVTLDDFQPVVNDLVKQATAAVAQSIAEGTSALDAVMKGIRQPEDGKSVTLADVQPVLDSAVQSIRDEARKGLDEAVKAIPVPAPGKDGENGKDGVGLAGAMIDRAGELLVTLTNGTVKSLGPVVGKDGKDGTDGISLDAFEMEYLEESHEVRIKAACAGRTKEVRFPAGGIRPAGYWRDGGTAKACEAWVHNGSTWYAKRDTTAKPDTGSDDWIVGARKGRDGQSIVKTIQAGPPAPIKLGA